MFGTKLAYVLLIPLLIAAGLLLQPAYTGFYAYVSGSSSGLGVWDSSDQQAGGTPAFINEPVLFYANFTDTSTSSPVTGAGVFCEIMFNVSGSWTNPDNMTYNPSTQLYEYNRSFELKGNYTWGARCDGSSGGYDDLSVNDSFHAYIHDWWNNSWKFRMGIDVSNGAYNVTDWPVEIEVNFTDVFRQMGKTHDFDENSTRLVEYNSTGYVMHEIPGQFDKGFGYNETTSAHGTYVFNLNGTTESNDNRSFYLYFDALGNGPKELASYATNISYSWSGDEIHVNNTRLRFYMDTNRSENTSGLYKVYFGGSPPYIFINDYDNNRTVEYTEYSNGTYNFSFAFMDNTNVTEGPVRLTVTQYGDEFYWGSPSSLTGEGSMLKRYHIYNRGGPESTGTFIKIEQNFTNNEAYSVFRNSTLGGSTALDVVKSWTSYGGSLTAFDGNTSDPYSWYYALSSFGDLVGIINIEETDAAFYATNSTGGGRVGIHLNGTTVSSSETISEKSVIYFGKGTGQTDEFVKIRNAFSDPPSVTPGNYEPLLMESVTQTDYDSYNRNETILITVNVTYDPYILLDTVNVTLDNATADQGDDTEIAMYDDGTNGDAQAGDLLYTNTYNVSLTEYPGTWNATAGIYDTKGNLINWSRKSFIVTDELYVNVSIVNKYGNVEREVNATVDIKNYAESVSHPGSQVNCSVFLASELIFDVNDDYIIDNGDGTYFLNFSAPSDFGHYTLRCNASKDGNDGYDTDTFDAEYIETNVSITITPGSYTLDNVTWTKNESFIIRTNSTNIANGTAYNATVSLEIPAEMSSNSTSSSCPGGNIPISESCIIDFNLTVLKTTVPSNFTVNSTISWDNANAVPGSNQTHMNATVLPTYVLSIPEDNITNTAFPGLQKNIGNITVRSYGNSPLQDVDINVTGFSSEFSFSFFPDSFASMTAGQVLLLRYTLTWTHPIRQVITGAYSMSPPQTRVTVRCMSTSLYRGQT